MLTLFSEPLAEGIISVAILAVLVAVAGYVIGKIRSAPAQQEPTANEMLSKFREMHAQGELSDEEFRVIKTQLADRLGAELNGRKETG